jgi:hypothetical protein
MHDADHPARDSDKSREPPESEESRRWLWRLDTGWPDSAGPHVRRPV